MSAEDNEAGEAGGDLASVDSIVQARVLRDVKQRRARDDEDEGWFRDYIDTDEGAQSLYSRQTHELALVQAARNKQPWFAQLVAAVGEVWSNTRPRTLGGGNGPALRDALVKTAALCVAWVEALDRRVEEKQLARPAKKGFWSWLKAILSRR